MPTLRDFRAKGVSFPEADRPDVEDILAKVPDTGTMHIAILRQPYLDLILSGQKTFESRFSVNRCAPFGRVAIGDAVLLKETGRPVTGYFLVSGVIEFDLAKFPLAKIREGFADRICSGVEEDFWWDRRNSRYCTLTGVGEHGEIAPLEVTKRDQRAWVRFDRVGAGQLELGS